MFYLVFVKQISQLILNLKALPSTVQENNNFFLQISLFKIWIFCFYFLILDIYIHFKYTEREKYARSRTKIRKRNFFIWIIKFIKKKKKHINMQEEIVLCIVARINENNDRKFKESEIGTRTHFGKWTEFCLHLVIVWNFPSELFAFFIQIGDFTHEITLFDDLQIVFVELQCGSCIFDGIMCFRLNFYIQKVPSEQP